MGRRPASRLALLLLVASLAVPAAAAAQSPAGHGHASARTERLALRAADAYWLQRGLTACPAPRIEYARLALRASGDAFIGPNLPAAYCVIRVSTALSWRGRAGAIDFCWTVVHERGHQVGLPHAGTGIMRADGGERPPAICARLLGH
ncbi:MAG: hypothetical protein JW895_03010 [Thermoleophilaceae bacterium]|nr:hypothetical protein [Thermoleophilaceae bacterium]